MSNWKDRFPKENRYFETDNGILYCADCLEIMSKFPLESVDLVIADPPYNSPTIEWDKKDNEFQILWLEKVKKILKEKGSFYCFFAPLNMYEIEGWIRKNLNLKNILVWHHPNLYGSGMSYGNDRYKSTWDVIFYAVKGEKAKHNKKIAEIAYLFDGRGFDVMIYPQPRPLLHKAQKPLQLITKLVYCSSEKESIVLDPFFGSGTTAIACEKLNRRWIGIEIDKTFCEVAKKRILKETRQLKLNFSQ